MQQALEELQRAIQHVLALGLGRAGGLEPLRDALRALQPHDALRRLPTACRRCWIRTTRACNWMC